MDTVSVRLSLDTIERLRSAAGLGDVTPGQIIRTAVTAHLDALDAARTSAAQDEPLLAHIRSRVATALIDAKTWADLQRRLESDGLRYVPRGGGVAVETIGDGRIRAKASQVGPSYAALVRRFGCGLPGHAHLGIARRVLEQRLIEDAGAAMPD